MAVLVAAAGTRATARATPGGGRDGRGIAVADTDSVARDSAARDSAARDSAARDSAGADSAGAALPGDAAAPTDTTEQEGTEFPEPDSVYRRLLEMGGFRLIEYRGRSVEFDVQEEAVRLRGEAQARYAGSVLEADTIAYRAGARLITARRRITLAGEGQNVTTDSILYYDVSGLKGTVMDARTSFAERGAEWYVRGNATLRGERTAFVETGSFTSCELDAPHYYFRAGQIKVVSENVIVAWPVTLYIHNVPVAWLPFFAQDIRPGRRSGFLPPRFGINDVIATDQDVRRSVTDMGYYWAINEFMDAQATLDWFSGRYTRVNGAFRYRSLKNFFEGNFLAAYSFNEGGGRTIELRGNHNQQLTPVTDFRVNANYISNTEIFEEQEFDPTRLTQRITSDIGLNHRFPFAAVSLSGRRTQELGTQRGNTDLTLPDVRLSFSPVTLFRAPRTRAGPFNNMVLNGALGFRRQSQSRESAADLLTTDGNANLGLRIGSFGISGNTSLTARRTTPFAEEGEGPAEEPFTRTLVNYGGQADYQVDLVGSTAFRPTVSVSAAAFRSPDTGDRFVSAPARVSVGASLTTDLYGFFPGFGPFSRVRHKLSPRLNYSFSPAVDVADSLLEVPGFPASSAQEQNRLSLTFNQTFEAKVREDVELDEEERAFLEGEPADSAEAAAPDTTAREGEPPAEAAGPETAEGEGAEPAPDVAPGEEAPQEAGAEVADSAAARGQEAAPGGAGRDTAAASRTTPRPPRRQRNVVLLAVNSSSLDFDFAREGEPVLVTDQWTHRVNSDLLRGLAINFSLDLFEGFGPERTFAPILSSLTGSFTFSSARGLGGLLGLGRDRGQGRSERRLRDAVDSRYRLQTFDENPDPEDPGLRSGGPWTLSVTYSMRRGREEESASDQQSLSGILSLNPTPNWSLSWRTSYNLTDGEFGQHLVSLDRDLHRWMASFIFTRTPNGNFLFQVSVRLRDAPDLKFDYDQRSIDR